MPWGTWITCEETVNGPDVGAGLHRRLERPAQQRHGFIFEVPAGGQSNRQPITSAGRFAHEAAAWNPTEGALYLTEDNFGFPSGFYRYFPPTDPMETGSLANGGALQMLRSSGSRTRTSRPTQANGATYAVDWVDIADPDPTFPYTPGEPAPTTNDDGHQLRRQPGPGPGRGALLAPRGRDALEGADLLHVDAGRRGGRDRARSRSTGYGNGSGQIWAYDPEEQTLTCVFQSPGAAVLDLPDNITHSERGHDRHLRGRPRRQLRARADARRRAVRHRAEPAAAAAHGSAPRFGDEFAGATFSPDGHTLFVNIQASQGMTFAIWGPWGRIGV